MRIRGYRARRVVSLAMRLTTESNPQLAMPMKVRSPAWPMSSALLDTGCEDLARGDGLARDPEHPAEVVAPAAREDPDARRPSA